MTKRYARIASAQVKQAVSGLDSVLAVASAPTLVGVTDSLLTNALTLKE
jgi:hypothetical protein